jgi:hypothetical protein
MRAEVWKERPNKPYHAVAGHHGYLLFEFFVCMSMCVCAVLCEVLYVVGFRLCLKKPSILLPLTCW